MSALCGSKEEQEKGNKRQGAGGRGQEAGGRRKGTGNRGQGEQNEPFPIAGGARDDLDYGSPLLALGPADLGLGLLQQQLVEWSTDIKWTLYSTT